MTKKERVSFNQLADLNKIREMFGSIENESTTPKTNFMETKEALFSKEEKLVIHQELLEQAGQAESDYDFDGGDLFGNTPKHSSGSKVVEVEYPRGYVGYVNIHFDRPELSEAEYQRVIRSVELISKGNNQYEGRNVLQEVEALGDSAIEVIYRESRRFLLSDTNQRNGIVQLLTRMTVRSLKGRRILKAILQHSQSKHHIQLAIMVSGSVQDEEVTHELLQLASNNDYFEFCLDALLKIRKLDTVKPLLNLIDTLDSSRKDLLEQAIFMAHRFNGFGAEAVQDVFEAYHNSERHQIRPVLSNALKSFKEDAIPFLMRVLEKETDERRIIRVCRTLGGLRHAFASDALKRAYEQFPEKRGPILDGLGHTNDSTFLSLIFKSLEESKNPKILEACFSSISSLGTRDDIETVRSAMGERGDRTYPHALFCLVKLGDSAALEEFIEMFLNGTSQEQYSLEKYMNRLPMNAIKSMSSRINVLPDNKATLIITALQRVKVPPREMGTYIAERFKRPIEDALRLELYRLIAMHNDTKNQLLPEMVLYDARDREENPRIKRELNTIIAGMKNRTGALTIKQHGDE